MSIEISFSNIFSFCGVAYPVMFWLSHIKAESDDVRTMVRDRRPEFPEMADRLQGYWIYYQRTSQQVDQFALYIHKSKEGRAYLAADWIEQTLALANYADLYMSAVDGANIYRHCRYCWSRLYRPKAVRERNSSQGHCLLCAKQDPSAAGFQPLPCPGRQHCLSGR